MGNSLSQDSQAILEAATAGDAHLLKQQIECEPKLLDSVTLVKRRGVLHLAAKQGHPHIISTVLDPLLEAVREEYHAHIDTQRRQQQQHQRSAHQQQHREQQQQQLAHTQPQANPQGVAASTAPQQEQRQRDTSLSQQASHSSRSADAEQTVDVQLPSFKRLRHTVNARDLYRRTPLIVAAKQGHLECTHLLVDAASNLFAVDREGNTSLHYAALHGHADVVEYLLQRAAERGLGSRLVNKRNLSGFTALHYAVWSCRTGVVVPLLAANADICAANDRVFDAWVPVPIGSTPLHLAVMRGSTPIALLLLQHHVLRVTQGTRDTPRPTDPRTLVNLYGMNPAQLAAHRNNRQMAQLLMPSLSLSRVLSVQVPTPARMLGAPSLKSIAAAMVQQTLTQKLDHVEAIHAVQAEQEQHTEGSSCKGACSKGPTSDCKGDCSVVCVQACSSDDTEAGAGVLTSVTGNRGASELVVVQAALSAGTTPASSRAASPAGGAGSPSAAQEGSRAVLAAAGCSSPAPSEGKSVTFSMPAAAAEAPAGPHDCDGGDGGITPLQHALTTASSSGWYDELCCVCWESEVTAAMEPCMHALCLGCARQLVSSSGTAGATCPLCRAYISGFGPTPPKTAWQQAGKRKKCLMAGAGI